MKDWQKHSKTVETRHNFAMHFAKTLIFIVDGKGVNFSQVKYFIQSVMQ